MQPRRGAKEQPRSRAKDSQGHTGTGTLRPPQSRAVHRTADTSTVACVISPANLPHVRLGTDCLNETRTSHMD